MFKLTFFSPNITTQKYNITDNPVAETANDAGYIRNIENVINGKGELIWAVPWVEGLKVRAASNYRYYG